MYFSVICLLIKIYVLYAHEFVFRMCVRGGGEIVLVLFVFKNFKINFPY